MTFSPSKSSSSFICKVQHSISEPVSRMLGHPGPHRRGPVARPPACCRRVIFHLELVFVVAVFHFGGGMKVVTPEERACCRQCGCSGMTAPERLHLGPGWACLSVSQFGVLCIRVPELLPWLVIDWPCRSANAKPGLFKENRNVW